MSKQYRWKGKIVTEKQYLRRVAQSEVGKRNKKSENCHDIPEPKCMLQGKYLLDAQVFAKHQKCTACKTYLGLDFVEREDRRGLGCDWYVRCHECLLMNHIPTGNKHRSPRSGKRDLFNMNTKAVAGTLHSGGGETHLNKILALLDIAPMSSQTFKSYEREIGLVAEKIADQSCRDAADIERALTIQNVEAIEKLLPNNLDASFLLPGRKRTTSEHQPATSTPLPCPASTDKSASVTSPSTPKRRKCLSESAASNEQLEDASEDPDEPDAPTTFTDELVRIMVSYDMGYSTRANGRQYDSLNGYAALIGCFSGKVLDYGNRNRKCRLCDLGHPPEDHDCRKNFTGSAKGMEADCAGELCNESKILAEKNLEVGIFVADNDASHISKVREGASHPVVKFSDRNHTTRGVDRHLYNFEKTHAEIKREGVHYLHRCFSYALCQNKGDAPKMAAAIRNIPEHCFNNHENCGDWCGFVADKENYDHSTIPGGFKDQALYVALKGMFDKLADNTETFAHCASSQANESLNNTMASKCPKSRFYSSSESADFRYAFSVANKNLGEEYLDSMFQEKELEKAGMTPVCDRTKKYFKARRGKAATRKKLSEGKEFKKNRQALKKKKAILRQKLKKNAVHVYETNTGLFSQPAFESSNVANSEGVAVVYFDLETSSFSKHCDILQLAARCGDAIFNVHINPVQPVHPKATEKNGLTNEDGELYRHGVLVPSVPLRVALGEFHQFLHRLGSPCLLVAHNGNGFDTPRIAQAFKSCQLLDEFAGVICGFSDTLPLLRKKLNRTTALKQTDLASEFLHLPPDGAHEAGKDVEVLQKLALHFSLEDQLMSQRTTLEALFNEEARKKEAATVQQTLQPLAGVLSQCMIGRLATAGCTFDFLVDTHVADRDQGIYKLFSEDVNGATRVTKMNSIIQDAVDFFDMLTA